MIPQLDIRKKKKNPHPLSNQTFDRFHLTNKKTKANHNIPVDGITSSHHSASIHSFTHSRHILPLSRQSCPVFMDHACRNTSKDDLNSIFYTSPKKYLPIMQNMTRKPIRHHNTYRASSRQRNHHLYRPMNSGVWSDHVTNISSSDHSERKITPSSPMSINRFHNGYDRNQIPHSFHTSPNAYHMANSNDSTAVIRPSGLRTFNQTEKSSISNHSLAGTEWYKKMEEDVSHEEYFSGDKGNATQDNRFFGHQKSHQDKIKNIKNKTIHHSHPRETKNFTEPRKNITLPPLHKPTKHSRKIAVDTKFDQRSVLPYQPVAEHHHQNKSKFLFATSPSKEQLNKEFIQKLIYQGKELQKSRLVTAFQRAALTVDLKASGNLFLNMERRYNESAWFKPHHLSYLFYLADFSSLGRSVVIKFSPVSFHAQRQWHHKHRSFVLHHVKDALRHLIKELAFDAFSSTTQNTLINNSIKAQLRLFRSLAPSICRLRRSVFDPRSGECVAVEYLNDAMRTSLHLPPSPFVYNIRQSQPMRFQLHHSKPKSMF